MTKADEEIIDFIAAGTTPYRVATFQASRSVRERGEDLISREKTSGLSPHEKSELDHCLELEYIMRLAKVRARRYLAHE